jgi:hypothetical protein
MAVMSDYRLSFARSPSPHYRAAVRLASTIPGYQLEERGDQPQHTVPVSESTLPLVEALLRLVSGWQSTRISSDGITLYREELWALAEMLRCYRRRQRSGLQDLHCLGLPEGPRTRVPCRLIDRSLGWEPAPEYADPELCTRLIHADAVDTTAELCPAFDAGRVVQALTGRLAVELLLDDVAIDLEEHRR